MKTYRWIFLMLAAGVFAGCGADSEDELIGDWQRRAVFKEYISHAATFVIGDKGYVVGGTNGNSGLSGIRSGVYEFNHLASSTSTTTSMGAWTPKKSFTGRARQQAVGFALNATINGIRMDYGFVGTGYGWRDGKGDKNDEMLAMRDFWMYDHVNDDWTEVAPLPENVYQRRGAIGFALYTETEQKWYGYVGLGYSDETDRLGLTDFWRFDPEGKTSKKDGTGDWIGEWTPVEEVGISKKTGAVVFVIKNRAYICNGYDISSRVYLNDLWRFDPNAPEKSRWFGPSPGKGAPGLRMMANVNQNEDYDDDYGTLKRAFGVAYVVDIGDDQLRGHIVGGEGGSGAANWEYDHDGDLWVQRTRFYNYLTTSAREGMISFSFPNTGRAYVGLGRSGSAYYDDIWEFIPMIEDDVYLDPL